MMPQPPESPRVLDDLIRRWPVNRPLAVVSWAGEGWSFVGEPRRALRVRAGGEGSGAGGATGGLVVECVDAGTGEGVAAPAELDGDPFVSLERVVGATGGARAGGAEMGCGWIGFVGYGLGVFVEPKACFAEHDLSAGMGLPLMEFQHCPTGFRIDHGTGEVRWIGAAEARPILMDEARDAEFEAGEIEGKGEDAAAAYRDAVERIIEYIGAGDVFQVNLAHRLSARFEGSMRGAFLALLARAQPWYGAYLELAPGADGRRRGVLSVSPELFLDVRPEGVRGPVRITTRPMKGTRPAPPLGDGEELRASEKDRAELNMIVDLMRNDLGRVCEAGTIGVTEPRRIEQHGGARGVLQATATVTGVLRPGVGIAKVLRATFPPGSVTGAPKIRAMQIIDELEPVERGVYCGAVGWIDGGVDGWGRASFNVGIRTAVVSGERAAGDAVDEVKNGRLSYSVGAGIVADSTPAGEWEETLTKARVLGGLARAGAAAGSGAGSGKV